MAEKSQRGSNLTREDRERGGKASASRQVRDQRGQFAGAKGKSNTASKSSSSTSSHSSTHHGSSSSSSNQPHGQGRAHTEQNRQEQPDDGKQSGGPTSCDTNPDQ